MIGKLVTLSGMRTLTQEIDARYWEHRGKISWANKASSSTPKSSSPRGNPPMKTSQDKAKAGPSPPAATLSTTPFNAQSGSDGTHPDLMGKLDSNGKLTQAEHNRHITQRLCLFYGDTGHFSDT